VPFTLSHAAAALPFRKLKPVWPALVIGTFAPDLQYFIQLTDEDRSGHHYPDVLLFTLPVALLVLWLFEWAVKRPAIELLPSAIQRRLQDKTAPLSFSGWRQFGRIVFWIAVGTLTHLVWDQFTHSYTRTAEFLPLLKNHISFPYWRHTTLAGLLQDASTILGLLALCIWCLAWYRRTPPSPATPASELSPLTKISMVAAMVLIAIGAGYTSAWFLLANRFGPVSRQVQVAITFLAMTQIFCLEMLLYGTAMTLRNRLHPVAARQLDEPAVKSG
jgi:Domain of unknown function (DUF4184)